MLLLLSILSLFAQFEFFQKSVSIEVLQGSRLEIIGESNVNCFTFNYNQEAIKQSHCIFLEQNKTQNWDIHNARIFLNVKSFKSGNPIMDRDFYKTLNADFYPKIEIAVMEVKIVERKNNVSKMLLKTKVKIANTEKSEEIYLNTLNDNSITTCKAETRISLSNYDIEAPEKFLGMVKVKDDLILKIDLKLGIDDSPEN